MLQANSIYFVENGTVAETYVTNAIGLARSVGNTAMINNIVDVAVDAAVDSSVQAAVAAANSIEIVANIAERDAMVLARNALVLVLDATGDVTVGSGGALYAYSLSNTTFNKITEYQDMPQTISWGNIADRPSSSPLAIDAAVAASHDHSNKAVLDKLAQDANGNLTYDGSSLVTSWTTINW